MPSCHSLYLFLGPDRARKLQRIQELERTLEVAPLDRHQLDAATLPPAQLLALCRQRPAASPRRLIVVEQAHRLDASAVGALVDGAEVIAKSACVVLMVETELGVRHPLSKAQGATATEQFPGRHAAAVKPFALTDALGTRDAVGALAALHDQLSAGKEPLELLGLVAWQLQRWVIVKRLLDAGQTHERIAAATGLRLWQVQRAQAELAQRSLRSLQQTLARCWQLDVDAKRGRAVPELAVEELVLEVCLPAGKAGLPAEPSPA